MADLSRKEWIPTKNTKNMRGNTRESTRESLKPTRYSHTCARSSKHERRYKIHDQQRTIQRYPVLLREEVLMGPPKRGS